MVQKNLERHTRPYGEYLKNKWNFTDEQIHQIFGLSVKNCEQTAPDYEIDVDELIEKYGCL